MRVGIITIGSWGDIQPYIALGKGFQRAGYEVRLFTHGAYGSAVRREGLDFLDLGVDPQTVMEGVMRETRLGERPNRIPFARQITFMREALREAQPLLKEGAERCWQAAQDIDALFFNPIGIYVAVPFAQRRKIPSFAAYVQPISPTREFASVLFPPAPGWLSPVRPVYNRLSASCVEWFRWPIYRGSIGKAVQAVLGTPLRSPIAPMRRERSPIFYGFSAHFLPRPSDWPDFCHVTGYWFLDTPGDWEPPADLRAFLQAGPPPVYVGFGSMRSSDPLKLTAAVIQALERCGQRGILLSGWGAIAQMPLPDTVLTIDAVPHDWLFPRVAAVVHHGGSGTTAAGLRAGVPSLIVPFIGDQSFWGWEVHERGLGPRPLDPNTLEAEGLAQAIGSMITDQDMRQRAARVGEQIRSEDGVGNVIRLFEQSVRSSPG
ncbi:MAG: glycosyltransferase [Anaerolineales bacterium]|jgi:UDP:flavonoid glycosyltransferase YjiC (YdhE family)